MTGEPPASFSVSGSYAGQPVTITWTADEGFGDPAPQPVLDRISAGNDVAATVTGPWYPPGPSPLVVAWLTAKQSLDTIDSWDAGGDAAEEALLAETALPDGAVS